MDEKRSYRLVFKNSFILTFLRVVEPLLAMVVIVAVSRVMGIEVMGGYSFIITFIAMFSVIGQMGLQTLITREVAANKAQASSYLSGALVLGLGSSVLLGTAMNLSKGYFNLSGEVSFGVWLMSLNLFPIFIIATFEAVFMGFERSDLIIYQHISGNVLRVLLSLLFIWLGLGLTSLVGAIVISTVFSVIICVFTYFRYLGKLTLNLDLHVSWRLLKSSPTFLFITLVWILWARLDILMLTKLTNLTQVALYAAAYKLFEATMIIPQSYMKASFPHLSSLQASPCSFERTNRHMLRHVLFYVFPITAAVVILSPFLVHALYGEKFSSSPVILQILVVGLIPWTIGRTFANALVARNLQRYDLLSGAFAVPVNIAFNLWLTPLYGAMGTAAATAASLSTFFVSQFYFTRRAGYDALAFDTLKLPLVAGLIVLLVVWVGSLGWPYASVEAAILVGAALVYLRRGQNRRILAKPFLMLQEIMRA